MDGLGNYESSKLNDALTDLMGAGSSPINVRATVTRKDASGVSWAMVNGKEFPLQGTTVQAQPGEYVNVSYDGISAYSSGNYSDPAASSRTLDLTRHNLVKVNNLVANEITANKARFESLEADTAYIKELKADNITAQDIAADHATVGNLDANYARINGANITTATIRDAWIDKLMVQSGLIAHEGTVYELDAIQVNAANITAGTLDVERLVVTVNNQKYLVHIDPQTSQPTYEKLDGNIIEDLTITADKIVAGAITAQKITTENLVGSGGWINLRNGTFNYTNATTGDGIAWDGQHLTINAASLDLSIRQAAQPNLSPYFSSTPYNASENDYWNSFQTGSGYTFTDMGDGWMRVQVDNTSGTATIRRDFFPVKSPAITPGGDYTFLVEFRNNNSSGSSTGTDCYLVQTDNYQFWGGSIKKNLEGKGTSSSTNLITDFVPQTAGVYTKRFVKTAEASGSTHWTGTVIGLATFTCRCGAGAKIDYEVRISLYEGEYTGPYKPYSGSQLYASQAELKVTNDNVSSKVSTTDYTGAMVASLINQAADSVKIQAEHIDIQGTITAINNDTTTTIDGGKIATNSIAIGALDSATQTKVNNGNSALTKVNYYNRSCQVGQSTGTVSNPWYKFASCSITGTNIDYTIQFAVQAAGNYSDTKRDGTLRAHVRTGGTAGTFSAAQLEWLNRATGIALADFVLAYKATSGSKVDVELWCKVNTGWHGFQFFVEHEATRTGISSSALWTLYNNWGQDKSAASITSGYTQIASTDTDAARGVAENYIYADSSGIRIASANPSTQNQRLQLTSSDATFYDSGGTQRVKINSSNGVIVGNPSKGRAQLTDAGMTVYDTNNKARAVVNSSGLSVKHTDGSTEVAQIGELSGEEGEGASVDTPTGLVLRGKPPTINFYGRELPGTWDFGSYGSASIANLFNVYDVNNTNIAYAGVYGSDNSITYLSSNSTYLSYIIRRKVNGKDIRNGVYLHITDMGEPVVKFPSNPSPYPSGREAWQEGLGIRNVGTSVTVTPNTVSCASGKYVQLASISLYSGTYLLLISGYCANKAGGDRWWVVTSGADSPAQSRFTTFRVESDRNAPRYVVFPRLVTVPGSIATDDDPLAFYVWGYQDSGSALSMSAGIQAVVINGYPQKAN